MDQLNFEHDSSTWRSFIESSKISVAEYIMALHSVQLMVLIWMIKVVQILVITVLPGLQASYTTYCHYIQKTAPNISHLFQDIRMLKMNIWLTLKTYFYRFYI